MCNLLFTLATRLSHGLINLSINLKSFVLYCSTQKLYHYKDELHNSLSIEFCSWMKRYFKVLHILQQPKKSTVFEIFPKMVTLKKLNIN